MRARTRLLYFAIAVGLLTGPQWHGGAAAHAQTPTAAPELTIPRHTRLLVVSPHPDDGTLAGGGLMARVNATGGVVHIVQMTSGDAFANGVKAEAKTDAPTADDYRRYGALREHETIAAMNALGLRRRTISFLGFPDDGLCRLVSDYRSAALAFESPYTRRVSPPVIEQLVRGAAYRGDDVERELERIIASFKPTVVLVPSSRDEHPDHCSTHMIVHSALAAVTGRDAQVAPTVLHFLIHYGVWPDADATGPQVLAPPARLQTGEVQWRSLTLAPSEAAAKTAALAAYGSQMLVIGPLMKALNRPNELFIEGDPASLPPCWCRGQDVAAGRLKPPPRTTP